MEMMSYCDNKTRCISLLLFALTLCIGCEPHGTPLRGEAPALTSDASASSAEYSYKHQSVIDNTDRKALREEFVVAVARVRDTRMPEGSTFGETTESVIAPSAVVTGVEVKGQADSNAPQKIEQTVEVKQQERLKPQSTPPGMGATARQQIVEELKRMRIFTVVERENINDILRELEFDESKWVAKDDQNVAGRLKAVKYIISGTFEINFEALGKLSATPDNWSDTPSFPDRSSDMPFLFTSRMYNVQTGEVVAVGTGYGKTFNQALEKSVRELSSDAIRHYKQNTK
jgi:hypothetical protein